MRKTLSNSHVDDGDKNTAILVRQFLKSSTFDLGGMGFNCEFVYLPQPSPLQAFNAAFIKEIYLDCYGIIMSAFS